MIFFDVTKTGRQGHRSGLTRVSERLLKGLGKAATPVSWETWDRSHLTREDWFLSAELFSELERPGLSEFLRSRICRTAAIFHDAIPLRHPHSTWPQSVARHPGYMKLLSGFDRLWAVSRASREDLFGFWRWAGVASPAPVDILALGADASGLPRVVAAPTEPPQGLPLLLCVGILEPRKNQALLLRVCSQLWEAGLRFELHLVGRVNPHFGKPLLAEIRQLQRRFPGLLQHHDGASDLEMEALYARACATLFPTLAEGCGLPLLESLWHGLPCLCSDLPVLRENADLGGCLPLAPNDEGAWNNALEELLEDRELWLHLAKEARTRPLPTWEASAGILQSELTP